MKLGKINHIGIVVADISEAKSRYSALLGIKNWYEVNCTSDLDIEYQGKSGKPTVTLYLGGKGNTKIELVEASGDSNIYNDFFEAHGEGIHHIMYNVKNLDNAVLSAQKEGYVVAQSGHFISGTADVKYAYVHKPNTISYIELIETTILLGIKKGDLPLELLLGSLTGSHRKLK